VELLISLIVPLAFAGLSFGSDDDEGSSSDDLENDVIQGGSGDNQLSGGGGEDILLGNRGDDQLFGGDGSDILDGGADDDTLAGGNDTDLLIGNSGNDLLQGQGDSDLLIGGAGDDTLEGGAGDDLLIASSGEDLLFGGNGDDVLWGVEPVEGFSTAEILDLDALAFEENLQAAYGSDLSVEAIDRIVDGINSADADTAADSLFGGAGEDILLGDNGDTLSGGDGDDAFGIVWQSGDNPVEITDYNVAAGEELIILSDDAPTSALQFSVQTTDDGLSTEVFLGAEVIATLSGVTLAQASGANILLQVGDTTFQPMVLAA
jgi:Ca2+-binding RTX toxin-like protein